jgi:hypothetical protein
VSNSPSWSQGSSSQASQQSYHSEQAPSSPSSMASDRSGREQAFYLYRSPPGSVTSPSDSSSSFDSAPTSPNSSPSQRESGAAMPPWMRQRPGYAASNASTPSVSSDGSRDDHSMRVGTPQARESLAARYGSDRAPSPAGSSDGRFSPPDSPPRHTGRGFSR